ncbi:transposable element Tcb1 transposase [Trichonephila clavipes]|nr:transposable element Tcb1 transposase [Trichonephila clavipes]
MCWGQLIRVIYTKRRLRTPSGEQASRRQQHSTPTALGMVWGVIVYSIRSPLEFIRGTLTAQRYVHNILQPHVLPFLQRFPGAIFQQNNARPHTTRVSQDCLRTVATLPCPARSPDFCPIEPIWDHLGRRVEHFTRLNELKVKLHRILNEMFQDIIQNLYASIPDHILSCIRARVCSTGY